MLMFFMGKRRDQMHPPSKDEPIDESAAPVLEKLFILCPDRHRSGAELKVMSSVESKAPGFFLKHIPLQEHEEEGFLTDLVQLSDTEVSYALGKQGATRRKLAAASGAIIEYVGTVAFIVGTLAERRRGRKYLKWLIDQKSGQVQIYGTVVVVVLLLVFSHIC